MNGVKTEDWRSSKFIGPQLTKHFQIVNAIPVWSCYTNVLGNNVFMHYKMQNNDDLFWHKYYYSSVSLRMASILLKFYLVYMLHFNGKLVYFLFGKIICYS